MSGYGRDNTFQVSETSASASAVTLKLPNAATGAEPAGETPSNLNPISVNQRYRIKFLSASFGVAAVTTPVALTITDGKFTFTFDVTGPLVLNDIDWQCAPGAEVDIVLAAGTGAIGHINVSYQVEG